MCNNHVIELDKRYKKTNPYKLIPSDDYKAYYLRYYNINSEVKELPGTKVYDDEKISKKHCVDNICVENAVLYYSSDYNSGRVEYTVVNNSDKTSSGKLQMVFKDTTIDIIYKDLEAGKSIDTRT